MDNIDDNNNDNSMDVDTNVPIIIDGTDDDQTFNTDDLDNMSLSSFPEILS